mmetsp:Transcript_89350/g.124095  ORF Transcript_89350/g.124095 Transcript_89350/m.124095 type:complete len:216 (-) Transcript_89350:53-700(-)
MSQLTQTIVSETEIVIRERSIVMELILGGNTNLQLVLSSGVSLDLVVMNATSHGLISDGSSEHVSIFLQVNRSRIVRNLNTVTNLSGVPLHVDGGAATAREASATAATHTLRSTQIATTLRHSHRSSFVQFFDFTKDGLPVAIQLFHLLHELNDGIGVVANAINLLEDLLINTESTKVVDDKLLIDGLSFVISDQLHNHVLNNLFHRLVHLKGVN